MPKYPMPLERALSSEVLWGYKEEVGLFSTKQDGMFVKDGASLFGFVDKDVPEGMDFFCLVSEARGYNIAAEGDAEAIIEVVNGGFDADL